MDFSKILSEVVAGKIRNKGLTTLFDTHHPSNAFIYRDFSKLYLTLLAFNLGAPHCQSDVSKDQRLWSYPSCT